MYTKCLHISYDKIAFSFVRLVSQVFFPPLDQKKENNVMVVGRGLGWQKVGIELGLVASYPTLSQPGMFQTFATS